MPNAHKKIFAVLFFSIFAAVTGVGIVVPLLPVYAADLGASGFYIGLIFGAFSLSRTVFLPLFGRISDFKGRKPFIAFGLLSYALISVVFCLTASIEQLIGVRFLQGVVSAMILPVAQAYVGDIAPEGHEGRFMGFFNFSTFGGLSLGPMLGGVINDRFSLDAAFFFMGALALAGGLLSCFWLPPVAAEANQQRGRPARWRDVTHDMTLIGLFVFRFCYAACIGIIWGFLPVLGAGRFGFSSTRIGFLVTLGVFFSGICQMPMGIAADHLPRKPMLIIGGLIVTASVYTFSMATGFYFFVIVSIIFGLGGGTAMPALMALAVAAGNRAQAMGTVMAVMTMAHSGGMLAGALVGGLALDYFSLNQAFITGGVMMGIATVFYFWSDR